MDHTEKSEIIYKNSVKSKDNFIEIYTNALSQFLGNKESMHIVDWSCEATAFTEAFFATVYALWEV